MNSLPALLIGGPPHAGKSVLFYSLTQALRERGIAHHAIRACPDGEGNWSQEADQETVRLIRIKSDSWPEEFTERLCRDIEQRLLPMLIDMGGKPQGTQLQLFQHCTHSLLLLKPEDEQSTKLWCSLIEANGLLPLAQLNSSLKQPTTIVDTFPVITGTLSSLERGTRVQGALFNALIARIASLFSSFSEQDREKNLLSRAPTGWPIELSVLLQAIAPGAARWEPSMIQRALEQLPVQTPLSIYGAGPHWLYGALAAFVGHYSFYQFDPRMEEQMGGWITPPVLGIGSSSSPKLSLKLEDHGKVIVLHIDIIKKHLDYLQAEGLTFPPIPNTQGLILSGALPSWLVTALVRLYAAHVAWIACYYPQTKNAVVMVSHDDMQRVGNVIPMPI